MEKPRTQADIRREKFEKDAHRARELGRKALDDIDTALAENNALGVLRMGQDELVRQLSESDVPPEHAHTAITSYTECFVKGKIHQNEEGA